ncbi:unnamed protein product [Nyctereutes procyonoides]|uniref:(raccoon dog) hypothetical protein n=1 Tax=Nyctereutes procyonoides TaxID=34880 RepID=A0A811Y6P2_NYCPR|nr:unnamed protein product [Nyctereutes procyonoides]
MRLGQETTATLKSSHSHCAHKNKSMNFSSAALSESERTEDRGQRNQSHLKTSIYKTRAHGVYSCFIQKCQSRWINKMWYIQTMECYSVIKRNEPQSTKRHGGNLNAYYVCKGVKNI